MTNSPNILAQIAGAVMDFGESALKSFLPPPSGRGVPAENSAPMGERSLWDRVLNQGVTPQVSVVAEATAGADKPSASKVTPTPDSPLVFTPEFSAYTMLPFGQNPFRLKEAFDLQQYVIGTVADPEINADISGSTVNMPSGANAPVSELVSKFPWWVWVVIGFIVLAIIRRK